MWWQERPWHQLTSVRQGGCQAFMLPTPKRGSETAAERSGFVRTTSGITVGWYNEERDSTVAVEGARTFVLTRAPLYTIEARDA